jgi:ABC-type nitrate/sulfonate/bicarbonate transport system substrate-binding protein
VDLVRWNVFDITKRARLVILLPCIWIVFNPGRATAQTQVKIGIVSPTFGHAPFYVARAKGFYKAEGLVGEVIVMNRDDLILQSLVSDSIQFGNISPSAFFRRGIRD